METLQYNNIIPTLKKLFPHFMDDDELHALCTDVPGLYLTFLIRYTNENWNDLTTQENLATLMNSMVLSTDNDVRETFFDFALDYYLHFKENKTANDVFMNQLLLPQTKHIILDAADYWYRANKNVN